MTINMELLVVLQLIKMEISPQELQLEEQLIKNGVE
jgi:hypothetical protein